MAFERPQLSDIIARVEGDIKGALSITTILRRSILSALARAVAGVSHILHGHMIFISRQIFPDQAEAELLDRWGSIYGMERSPATFAQLQIEVTFTAAGTVPAGTIYQRIDGEEYVVDADIDGTGAGTFTGTVTASTEGSAQNLADGDIISLQSPIANVNSEAEILDTLIEGEDRETDESYRLRIVDRIQQPPAGGTANDFIQWAREVSGVTRAWVFPGHLGEGTVGLSFVEDNESPIIPDNAKVDEVQDYVELKKPVTAQLTVFAPTDVPVNLTIAIKPNTLAVRTAVEAELEDLFIREAQVRGAYKSVGQSYDGKIALSKINEAISLAPDEEDHNIVNLTEDPQPPTVSGLLTLGTITWQTLA